MTTTQTSPAPTVTVTAGEYTDRNLPTASWWDRYRLTAGEYPVRFTTIQGHPVDGQGADGAYYGVVEVPAVLVQSFRVNRLHTATAAEITYPGTETVVRFSAYRYEITPGTKINDLIRVNDQ